MYNILINNDNNFLQRGRILTAMGWQHASLKQRNISGTEISQRNVHTAFSVFND